MLRLRRKRSWKRQLADAARSVPPRGRELRAAAAAQLDLPWARSKLATLAREYLLSFLLDRIIDYYAARRATGRERLSAVKGPVILVANHSSHMDTPVILSALPRRLRKRTVVGAAADYFYRNRLIAAVVSLFFNTVPVERRGGGLSKNGSHLDRLLDEGWNLLLYPEGTRSRNGAPGRVRRGAAVLAAAHHLKIVPIRVTGTAQAMPPGRLWPRRQPAMPVPRRHRIEIAFGEPLEPTPEPSEMIDRLQSFFDNGDGGSTPYRSPYRGRATSLRQ